MRLRESEMSIKITKTILLVTPKELTSRQVNQVLFFQYTYLNFSTK